MGCLLQVFANQKDKSRHLYEHSKLGRCHLTGLRPALSSGKPGDRGRSPRLVGHEEIAFPDREKQNANEEMAIPDEEKRNARVEITFPDQQKQNPSEKVVSSRL